MAPNMGVEQSQKLGQKCAVGPDLKLHFSDLTAALGRNIVLHTVHSTSANAILVIAAIRRAECLTFFSISTVPLQLGVDHGKRCMQWSIENIVGEGVAVSDVAAEGKSGLYDRLAYAGPGGGAPKETGALPKEEPWQVLIVGREPLAVLRMLVRHALAGAPMVHPVIGILREDAQVLAHRDLAWHTIALL